MKNYAERGAIKERKALEEGAERLKKKCVTRTSYINVTQEQASGGREQRGGAEEGAEGGASMGYRECREAWLSHFQP